jgi:copper homeostasis protein
MHKGTVCPWVRHHVMLPDMVGNVLVEACVDTIESAAAAAGGGAQRLELCANLVEGGTTPSAGVTALTCARLRIAVHVMIRPRGGDFCYTPLEFEAMQHDVAEAKRLGAAGVVFGILEPDGTIDAERTRALVKQARPLPVTFHRAFDVTRDAHEALGTLITLGVDRVLTSGQQASVPEGLPLIAELVRQARHDIEILPGGGITPQNVAEIVRVSGVREVHVHAARAFPSPMRFRRAAVVMGGQYEPDEYRRSETAVDQIAAVVEALGGIM